MYVVIIMIIGLISSLLINKLFHEFKLYKKNYRGQLIPYSGGTIIFVSAILSFAVTELFGTISYIKMIFFTFIIFLAYSMGLLHDLFGNSEFKGISSNKDTLLGKIVSMGIIKGIFYIVLSCYLYYFFNEELWVLKGIMTSLFTNLSNLLDFRPGRCIKFYFIFCLLLSFAYLRWTKESFIIFSVLLAIYYFWDAYGYSMLGNSGSNLVGFIAGLTVSEALGTNFIRIILTIAMLAAVQFMLDKYSFTQFIMSKPLFDYIDRFLTERQSKEGAES